MSRITNELAERIAKIMTIKKQEELDKLKTLEKEIVWKEAVKDVPEDIMKMFKDKNEYVNIYTHVYLSGHGLYNANVSIEEYPCKSNGGYYINVSPEFGKEYTKLRNLIEKKRNELSNLKVNIENVLKQMKTFKRVREEFLEAAEFLPPDGKPMLPAINLSSIRESLK